MSKIIIFFLFGSFAFGVTVAEINIAYNAKHKAMRKLIREIDKTTEEMKKVTTLLKVSNTNQKEKELFSDALEKKLMLFTKQGSNLADIEMQRAESSLMQNKQMVFNLGLLSAEVGREEIKDLQKKISKKNKSGRK